ncbi:class B sortase [Anaerofustis stercorihominis]|nr:class B sortase [Anaerofustis stercorihominis]MCQ4794764.1 class B sortase [Anaerofustis stercorihominis]
MKRKNKLRSILLLVFSVLFFVSAYMVYGIISLAHREQDNFERLEETIKQPSAASDPVQPQEPSETDAASSPYAALKEQNPDFFGWISIEGTELNYPVMHTPKDEEYYLRRDFNGEDSQSGVPFLSASCYEGCGNYLIYGHNMKNGSMFATLLAYADRDFGGQHPSIRFDTLSDSGEYEVIAAFYSEVYSQDASNVFRFYQYTDLCDPDIFTEYMEQVQEAALYDTGINAKHGDSLLTLSTCSYHTKNGRFVVVARGM